MSDTVNRDNILRLHETIKSLITRVETIEGELKNTRSELQHTIQQNVEMNQKYIMLVAMGRGSGATA